MLIVVECTSLEASLSPSTRDVPFKLMKPSLFKDHFCFWHGSAGLASWILITWRLRINVHVHAEIKKMQTDSGEGLLVTQFYNELKNTYIFSDSWAFCYY